MKRLEKPSGFHYFQKLVWALGLNKLILIYLGAPTNMNGKSSCMCCSISNYAFNSGNMYSVPNRLVPIFFLKEF